MASINNKLTIWGRTPDEYGSGSFSSITNGFSAGSLIYAQQINKAFRNATVFQYCLAQILANNVSVASSFDIAYDIPANSVPSFINNLETAVKAFIKSATVINRASVADAFSTARTIELSGDISGSFTSTGLEGWTINTTIGTSKIIETMIKDGNVGTNKIANFAITTAKLADLGVTNSKIANGTITGSKISSATITSVNLGEGAVTNEKILNGTIENDKLVNSYFNFINNTYSLSANLGDNVSLYNLFGFSNSSTGILKFASSNKSFYIEPDIEGEDWKIIPNNYLSNNQHITNLSFPYASIVGANAFANCINLINISIPKVQIIENNAFENCHSLNSFPSASELSYIGDNAFLNCNNIRSLSNSQINTIGSNAFNGCTNLNVISLPNLSYVGENAFYNTNLLSTVSFPNLISATNKFLPSNVVNVDVPKLENFTANTFINLSGLYMISLNLASSIPTGAFSNKTNLNTCLIPNAETIGSNAFNGCTNLVQIGNTTNNFLSRRLIVSDYAFKNCSNLTKIDLRNCEELGRNVFENCYNLSSVNITTVGTIPSSAFLNCSKLSFISMTTVETIENGVFEGCLSLSNIYVPYLITIGAKAFKSTKISGSTTFVRCTYMGNNALEGTKFTTISLPSLRSMGSYVFSGCSIIELSLPKIIALPSYALGGMSNLATIRLGSTCQSISPDCFPHNAAFNALYLEYNGLVSYVSLGFSNNYFSGTGITSTTGNIYVPSNYVSAYRVAAGWSYYANRIHSIS